MKIKQIYINLDMHVQMFTIFLYSRSVILIATEAHIDI